MSVRILVLALLISFGWGASGEAVAQECPADSTETVPGSMTVSGTHTIPVNLAPCQTVLFDVTTTGHQSYGASVAFSAWTQETTPRKLWEYNWASYGTVTKSGIPWGAIAKPWVPPYRGTRGVEGLIKEVRISASFFAGTFTYSITIQKVRRPDYNTGGTNFSTAPLIPLNVLFKGSLHNWEPGQYYKIHLDPQQSIRIAGTAMASPQYGANLYVEIYNANQVFVMNLINAEAVYGTKTFPSTASPPTYSHTGSSGADYFLRVWSRWYPMHDFQLMVNSPMLLDEVGFKYDRTITKWDDNEDIDPDDGTEPTWKRVNNPDYPVAYPYSTSPTIFATVSFNPPLSGGVTAAIRAKAGTVVVAQRFNATLGASGGRIEDIPVIAPLESTPGAGARDYTWNWELSLNGGSTWAAIGASGPHQFYWTYGAPFMPTFFGQSHTPTSPEIFAPLYDLALQKATAPLTTLTTSQTQIAEALTAAIAGEVVYDPAEVVDGHPLELYEAQGGMCANHANLLRGLLRSLGIDATTYYVRGGTFVGGVVERWRYRFQDFDQWTLRVQRAPTDQAGLNPHFTYHAVVAIAALDPTTVFYDPSYGDSYTRSTAPIDETVHSPSAVAVFNTGAVATDDLTLSDIFVGSTSVLADPPDCPHQPQSEFVSQTVPSTMSAGGHYNVTIRMKNVGSVTWDVDDVVLASKASPGTWGIDLVELPDAVAPDSIVEFNFEVVAPTTPGTYQFRWQMMWISALQSFGVMTPTVTVEVQ